MPVPPTERKPNTRAGLRVAMWSGPRNVSTALLRAWENRPDTIVVDEPFYACYLARSGLPHPGRAQVLAAQPTDWRDVVAALAAARPPSGRIVYEKHMTHHIDDDIDLDWLDDVLNCFLIREPRRMLASLLRVLPHAGLAETGLPQQLRLFERVRRRTLPPVIDSADLLRNPRAVLAALCQRLAVPFSDSMLRWPPGPRDSDGVWAPHWYASVERSTGFEPYRPAQPSIPAAHRDLLSDCEEIYAELYPYRIAGDD